MDAYDIFKKLTCGVKFDTKKFRDDAVKFQLIQPRSNNNCENGSKRKNDLFHEELKEAVTTKDSSDDEGINLLKSVSSKTENKIKKKKRKKTAEHLAQIKQEKINQFRNQNRINVSGTDIPEPIEDFESLQSKYNVHSQIIKNVNRLGYADPTPIQMQAIPVMIKGREVLACAPTGSGKTAAFLIPILHDLQGPKKLGFRAVIVTPTRELARQTYLECCRLAEGLGFRIHIIDKVGKAMKKFGPATSQKFDILVTTPNRLIYLINQEPPVLNLKNVQWLIIDESDKLFESGTQGFRDQLGIIYKACSSPNIRHAMFSATFAFEVEDWCKLNLDNVITVSIGVRNTTTDLVKQELIYVGTELGKLVAFRDIVKQGLKPPVLVFVQTKERAKELFNELIYDAINVDVIHADRTQLQRDNVVKSFREGKIWVLICTELMGRGIDFKGVNLVVNYDFPPTIISYIHRIGRTGRAGRPGKAVTFFTEDDKVNLRSIAQVMRDSGCEVPEYMLELKKPNKKIKRKLKQSAVKRNSISTVPLYDIEKAKKRRMMIAKSKKKKAKSE